MHPIPREAPEAQLRGFPNRKAHKRNTLSRAFLLHCYSIFILFIPQEPVDLKCLSPTRQMR